MNDHITPHMLERRYIRHTDLLDWGKPDTEPLFSEGEIVTIRYGGNPRTRAVIGYVFWDTKFNKYMYSLQRETYPFMRFSPRRENTIRKVEK